MERRIIVRGLILLLSGLSAGVLADGTVPRYAATASGVGCWDLGAFSQLHAAKNQAELVADNPLVCEIKQVGSSQDWAWASPCTGCERISGKVDVIPAGSFLDPHVYWYVNLPDHTRLYAVGRPQHFDVGLRMVRLWISARDLHRLDGKPLPKNPKWSGQ